MSCDRTEFLALPTPEVTYGTITVHKLSDNDDNLELPVTSTKDPEDDYRLQVVQFPDQSIMVRILDEENDRELTVRLQPSQSCEFFEAIAIQHLKTHKSH